MYSVSCVQGEALNYIMLFGRPVSRLNYGDFNARKTVTSGLPTLQRFSERKILHGK